MRSAVLRSSGVLAVVALGAWLGVARGHAQPPATAPAPAQHLQGFDTVVVNHVNHVLGTELLPVASGGAVEPGIFVTVTMDELQVYDQPAATLQGGRPTDATVAPECRSGCPAVFYDALSRSWLEAAVESTAFAVEIPQRVLLAVHAELPARTLLEVAYAASETRPIQPPQLSMLVNNTRGGLRAQPFFLVPPGGLELRQGSAVLGLQVDISPGRYRVSAADPRFAREREATTPTQLQAIARDVKKQYPGKESVVLIPGEGVTVRELMKVVAIMHPSFPRVVLGMGPFIRRP